MQPKHICLGTPRTYPEIVPIKSRRLDVYESGALREHIEANRDRDAAAAAKMRLATANRDETTADVSKGIK